MTDDDASRDAAEKPDEARAESADAAEPAPAPAHDGASSSALLSSKKFLITLGVAAVALIAAVVLGVLWWTSVSSDEHRLAEAREKVVLSVRQGITAYTEIDHTKPDAYREGQREISTDELFQQNQGGWDKAREDITKNEIKVKAKIFDVGVLELNTHKGEAVALAAIEITRSAKGMEPTPGRMRMVTKLQRVDDEWKLADIQHVPEIPTGA